MIVRAATIADAPQLLALGPTVFANGANELGAFDANAWMAEVWRLLNHKDRAVFVALSDAAVVGVHVVALTGAFIAPIVITARTLTLWVNPQTRGQGLATMLQASAEQWARKAGATFMMAGVPSDYSAHAQLGDEAANPDTAQAFYRARGYVVTETQLMKELR